MNYKLTNFQIETVEGNRIQGQEDEQNEMLRCVALNPVNRFEKPHNIVIFDKVNVDHYKNLLPESRGGVLPDEGWDELGIPAEDRFFLNGTLVPFHLGGEYCRKYTSAIVDAAGNVVPGKDKDDFIRGANGRITHFNTVMVFCQYQFRTESVYDENTGMPKFNPSTGMPMMKIIRDEHGRPIEEWVQGWAPEEIGERMRKLLVPYTPDLEDEYAENDEEVDTETGEITREPAATPPVGNRPIR